MLKDTVQKQMIEAMKQGDKARKLALSGLMSALKNKEIELRGKGEMNTEAEVQVVSKLVKQTKESLDTCPKDRTDIIEKLTLELEVYESFMPAQMSKEEIHDTIERLLDHMGILQTASPKDKGRIMKELMPMVKGKADGKLVNEILSIYLK